MGQPRPLASCPHRLCDAEIAPLIGDPTSRHARAWPGLARGIHENRSATIAWMAGTSPAMTPLGGAFALGAFDDEGAAGAVGEAARQDLLELGRVVPALHRGSVGEFEDDDGFRLRAALDQLGGAAPGQEAAAILRQCGGNGGPVRLHPGGIMNFEFDDKIGWHRLLPANKGAAYHGFADARSAGAAASPTERPGNPAASK